MPATLTADRPLGAAQPGALLAAYRRTRDPALRRRLVETHLPYVRALAARYARRGEPMDDLIQVGSIGLLKALDRFDPERGVPFEAFASPTITGEIRRHFRDRGWAISVPRSLQELGARVVGQRERLTNDLGRSPTVTELADAVDAPLEQVLECLQARDAYRPASLDVPAGGGGDESAATVGELIGSRDAELSRAERRVTLDEALAHLDPRDRTVVYLRFWEDLTQREIAARVGVSQMQVSRILRRSMDALRAML
jgi:RNA polymerase sigma-B factor